MATLSLCAFRPSRDRFVQALQRLARLLTVTMAATLVFAAPPSARAEPTAVDRVILRWYLAETGRKSRLEAVFERELAFEARLEALAAGSADKNISDRFVRAALNRHIAESLLANLPLDPPPTTRQIEQRAELALHYLEMRVGGEELLFEAARQEGIADAEISRMVRRSARATIYLERVIAPQVEPTRGELMAMHRSGLTPFSDKPFADVHDALQRWVAADRLAKALDAYYQKARSRVVVLWTKR